MNTRHGIIPIPVDPFPLPPPDPLPANAPGPVTPPSVSNRRAVQTTRTDATWVARRDSQNAWDRLALPSISIGALGHDYVNIPSLFWVDRTTYDGQRLVDDQTLSVPWTLSWNEDVTTTTTAPCAADPLLMCTSSETHTEHRQQSYTDTYEVEVQAVPTRYVWDFGDGRPASSQVFDPVKGLGLPYAPQSALSPVAYRYEWSSLNFVAQGGFRIQLDVTWGAAERWHMTSDFGDSQDGGGFLSPRQSHFETRHEVREVRSVIVQ